MSPSWSVAGWSNTDMIRKYKTYPLPKNYCEIIIHKVLAAGEEHFACHSKCIGWPSNAEELSTATADYKKGSL